LSVEDHREIHRRVTEGETFALAAAAVGCSTKSIQRFMARTGGLFPKARERSPLRLSPGDREELSRGLLAGESFREIAERLGRSPSTISREVSANGCRSSYRAWLAEQSAARRARRPKTEKLAANPRLCREVERRLLERWSPQQIAARLVRDYPDDQEMRVSHETIYRTLFVQARGALRKELAACLRTGRTQRCSHKRTEHTGTGRLREMVMISDRPAEAADRAIPGHWEGDLLMGRGGR
jgi:IS30 family transposase